MWPPSVRTLRTDDKTYFLASWSRPQVDANPADDQPDADPGQSGEMKFRNPCRWRARVDLGPPPGRRGDARARYRQKEPLVRPRGGHGEEVDEADLTRDQVRNGSVGSKLSLIKPIYLSFGTPPARSAADRKSRRRADRTKTATMQQRRRRRRGRQRDSTCGISEDRSFSRRPPALIDFEEDATSSAHRVPTVAKQVGRRNQSDICRAGRRVRWPIDGANESRRPAVQRNTTASR